MAFKYIEIYLTEPICSCDKQNLKWRIKRDADGGLFLYISCHACKSELVIPHEKFVAVFKFDKSYPGGVAKKDESGGENSQPSPVPLDDFFRRLEKQMENPRKRTKPSA